MPHRVENLADLPDAFGAYALVVRLTAPLALDRQRWQGRFLAPGLYIYCGNANGPGGIGARLQRHTRPSKVRHWHIDSLTGDGRVIGVGAFAGGHECRVMDSLSRMRGMQIPVRGFGSSDCRDCEAHLVRFTEERNLEYLFRRLGADTIWLASGANTVGRTFPR